MTYKAPLNEIMDTVENICGLPQILNSEIYSDFDIEIVSQIIEAAAKFAEEIVAPTNKIGDKEGASLVDGAVVLPQSFLHAYQQMVEGGWQGISFDASLGGMGLPKVVGMAAFETIHSANMAFGLCPMLSMGALDALKEHGTPEQQAEFLPNLISGKWSGTMNLTEPQAGSDVGALTTRATKNLDGTYTIIGQKIFITWGDHDFASNIIHLVLARLPGAPAGPKGISLFIVPKFLKDENGGYTIRNDVGAVSLEHKLGINASPTCVMSYGEGLFSSKKGSIGYLIGAENNGMACMFTMMNAARLNVGLQGVSIAELATQKAVAFTKERIQGQGKPIIEHPDVRKMLLKMRAKTNAARAICYLTAAAEDMRLGAADEESQTYYEARASLLTPIAKAWSTDIGVEVASIGIQVHGGMGYIEETGAAQYLRDARIAPIYEGTNGIQALDLIGRKLMGDKGAAFKGLIDEIIAFANSVEANYSTELVALAKQLSTSATTVLEVGNSLINWQESNQKQRALWAATDFLELCGNLIGGFGLLSAATRSQISNDNGANQEFLARFYFDNILSNTSSLYQKINSDPRFDYEFS